MTLTDRVARLEYTGTDRCWMCTAVNVVVIAIVCLLVGLRHRALALSLGAVGLALVYIRGYVVPYTPAFAPRLVAVLGLTDRFEGTQTPDEEGTVASAADAPAGEELLGALAARGILVTEAESVAVEPATFDAWQAKMADLAVLDTPELAAAVSETAGVDASDETAGEREYVVLGGTWLSRPVAVAETAAVRVVAERFEDHATLIAAASVLRMFLSACPDCGSELHETTTASCCGGYTNPTTVPEDVLACPDCGVWLYRFKA